MSGNAGNECLGWIVSLHLTSLPTARRRPAPAAREGAPGTKNGPV